MFNFFVHNQIPEMEWHTIANVPGTGIAPDQFVWHKKLFR